MGEPVAFLSYAHADDDETNGTVTIFHGLLLQELRVQSAGKFQLFRDRNDLQWGQAWQRLINETLDSAVLLVVVVSPSFFASSECRQELERFLAREGQLGQQDLILPVYWIETPIMEDEAKRRDDTLGECIASRQYRDCRSWRFKLLSDSVAIRPDIAELAKDMIDVVNRPLYSIRPTADEAIKTNGVKLGSTVRVEARGDQWLTDLADLKKATPLIDPDQRKRIMEAILTRRFGEF